MNIVLIGMRGSGKTVVGKLLATTLKKDFAETDVVIAEKEGKIISQIVRENGWDYFRDLETEVVKEAAKKNNCVVSCGGGIVLKKENISSLKKNGKFFWLQVSIDTLLKRIGEDSNRPFLTNAKSRREDMEMVLQQRYSLYENAADVTIDTENKTPTDVAEKIIQNL